MFVNNVDFNVFPFLLDVTNKRFPPSDVDAQEKLIRTTVGVKFNNVAAKLKKQLLKPSERILSDAIEENSL